MEYKPFNAVNAIYNLKGQWVAANQAGDTETKNRIATKAQDYYKELRDNGYGYVADELEVSSYDQSKAISDKWKALTGTGSGPVKSGVDNPAYNQSLTSASNKNNEYFETIKSDHANVNAKYDDIFDYANQDITETDEYKSAWDNVMPSYNLAAMQGRKNEVASGGASNGGNVDSFAAANAMRQQSAVTAKGQALAHQMGLESYATRVDKVRGVLSDLGVYNNGVYAAMSDSITHDRGMANDIFNNEQTAKNNEVARLSEQASVTGYVPKQWQYSNNPYFNADGTLNEVYTSKDFDATGGFTTIINNAKAKLATTTDANERANLQATINYATQAKAYKTLGSPYYAQWAHEVEAVTPSRTAEYELTDKQIISAENIAKGTNDLKLTLADKEAATQLALASKKSAVATTKPALTATQAATAIKNGEISQAVIDAYNYYYGTEYTVDNPPRADVAPVTDDWTGDDTPAEPDYETSLDVVYNDSSKTVKEYIRNELKPFITQSSITEDELRKHLIDNSETYDLEVDDIKAICKALGVDSMWADDYKNSGLFGWGSGVKKK